MFGTRSLQSRQDDGGEPNSLSKMDETNFPSSGLVNNLNNIIIGLYEPTDAHKTKLSVEAQTDGETLKEIQDDNARRMKLLGLDSMARVHEAILRAQEEMAVMSRDAQEHEAASLAHEAEKREDLKVEEAKLLEKQHGFEMLRREKIEQLLSIAQQLRTREEGMIRKVKVLQDRRAKYLQARKQVR